MIRPEQAPRVLGMQGDFNGCVFWRCTSPMRALHQRGYPVFLGQNKDERTTACIPGMDAVIYPRLSWRMEDAELALLWREELHSLGISMVFEWDDDVFSPEIVERTGEVYPDENKTLAEWETDRQERIYAVGLADGITCSTQRLATVIRQYTDKPVKVVPNLIDLVWWRQTQSAVKRGLPEPVIGWAGGRRPDRDVLPMAEAWARVAQRHPDAWFVVAGDQPAIFGRIPECQLVRSPWLPVLEYPRNYVGVDIGCCPLADEPFNACKSNIKALEWAASGAAVVASPTVYGDLIESGRTGFIAETTDDWEWAIETLLADRDERQAMAARLLEVVERDWALDRHVLAWVDAWAEIVEAARDRLGGGSDIITPDQALALARG